LANVPRIALVTPSNPYREFASIRDGEAATQ